MIAHNDVFPLAFPRRPRLLDLFCGAGGAAYGYWLAGFEVTGVDIAPQPRYPFRFIQADALDYAAAHGHEYDVIHASPPCQRYSSITTVHGTNGNHPDLIAPVRQALQKIDRPYIIENVPGARAELDNPLMLCGTMFDLLVIRHRYFESNPPVWFAPQPCQHLRPVVTCGRRPNPAQHYASVVGHHSDVTFARAAMGIPWMTQGELSEAIPPAYTRYIGAQLMRALGL